MQRLCLWFKKKKFEVAKSQLTELEMMMLILKVNTAICGLILKVATVERQGVQRRVFHNCYHFQ